MDRGALRTFVNIPEEACMVDDGGRRRVPLSLGHELLASSFAMRDQLFESTLLAGGTRREREGDGERGGCLGRQTDVESL